MEKLFQLYLQNQCTVEELKQVFQHLKTPQGQALIERLTESSATVSSIFMPKAEIQANAWAKLEKAISQDDEEESVQTKILPIFKKRIYWAAAAVLIPLLLSTYFYFLTPPPNVVAKTEYAKIQRVVLPDGSIVTLNGNSTITYPKEWSKNAPREVWLKGEAFFQVTHKLNHQKFLVHTRRDYTIEVLGTEFNVSDRVNGTQVKLKSGKIKLIVKERNTKKGIMMKPGQSVDIDTTAQKVAMTLVKPDMIALWREQKLVFDGTTLSEISQILKETYNLNVSVNDPNLLLEKITGVIPSGNAEELLKALSITLKLKYTNQNNQVKFY